MGTAATCALTGYLESLDIDRAVSPFGGCEAFEAALASITNSESLLRCLAQYVHFNAAFGSGVASLAGAIGARLDLFRDATEPAGGLADRSTEIAAAIFFAAVDEFGGASARCPTHRAMAQELLRAAASHLGAPLPGGMAASGAISSQVCEGYGVGRRLHDAELFAAIGFHLGSEFLADREFALLDEFLRSRYLGLVRRLEQTRTRAGHPAYLWIRLHTTVEADHFERGLRGANRALDWYAGQANPQDMRAEVLSGARRFAGMQAAFMRTIFD
jgi:hypothetical protein